MLLQHVYALQQLEGHLKEGACALDVGSGSGYLTAAMAYTVSTVISINMLMYSKKLRIYYCPSFLSICETLTPLLSVSLSLLYQYSRTVTVVVNWP